MLALRAVPNSQFLIKLSVFEKITKHIKIFIIKGVWHKN